MQAAGSAILALDAVDRGPESENVRPAQSPRGSAIYDFQHHSEEGHLMCQAPRMGPRAWTIGSVTLAPRPRHAPQ